MTDWNYFIDKPNFVNFITYLINKHQVDHQDVFRHFLERKTIQNAWGNEIKKRRQFESSSSLLLAWNTIFNKRL